MELDPKIGCKILDAFYTNIFDQLLLKRETRLRKTNT